jgi:hypothetical protein
MAKFMQSLNPSVYAELERLARERDVSIQELFRSIIIPEWLKFQSSPPTQKKQADPDEFSSRKDKRSGESDQD